MIDKISLYRSFACVARSGSISAAAKELFVTQPAVSSDILALERELGVSLFSRTNRGMKLTPEGNVLYGYIREAFAFIESGEDALRDITGLHSGIIRIGASDMTLKFYLLDYIEAFRKKHPDIRLSITNNPTPKTLEALKAGEIDFGVISDDTPDFSRSELEAVPVRRIRDIFVCAPDCPLAKEKKISTQRLREFPLILLEKNTSTRRYLNTQPGYEDLEAEIELSTSELLIEFALRGVGVASVVEDFALPALKEGRLCRLDLATPPTPRQFLLTYLKNRPLNAASRALVGDMLAGKKQ